MKSDLTSVNRRAFLRGLGGITVGLPMLDLFERRAAAAAPAGPIYSLFFVGDNGVMQSWPFGEAAEKVEMFWPTVADGNSGVFKYALTKAALLADRPNRSLGELSDYAERLLLLKGIDHPFGAGGCTHHYGNQQVLTAAKVNTGKDFQDQLAAGESIDNRIARELNPEKREPLGLQVGESLAGGTGYGYPSYVSFRGPNMPRAAEANPINAYNRMVGVAGMAPDLAVKLQKSRKSVNDLVRAQMQRLLARTDLSTADHQRLDQHFTAIREIEIKLTNSVDATTLADMKTVDGKEHDNANHDKVIRLNLDLIAFAFASDYTRTAVLKTGDINDRTRWTIDGALQPVFHMISHRVLSDGADGAPIANAQALHSKIDRIHALHFKYFLDKISQIDTPQGKLIDRGFFAWTNQIGTGKYHSFRDIPWVIAGNAGGYLKTGQFLNVNAVNKDDKDRFKSNKLLSTLLSAAGVRKADGSPVDDFGDASLEKGILPDIVNG